MTLHSIKSLSETTPTLISFKAVHSGRDITIQNLHASAYVYIGAENVSTTNYGFRINPDTEFSLELGSYDELWAVTSSNGSQVAALSANLE